MLKIGRPLLLGAGMGALILGTVQLHAQDAPSFRGKALLILSDTTMPASGFVDGQLVRNQRDRITSPDTLTVLSLPLRLTGTPADTVAVGEVEVSNSVVGPPFQVTASPDGRFAYVLETRGNPPKGVEKVTNVFQGLPTQSRVTVVDISNHSAPKVVESVVVGSHTHTIDLSPDGRLLAVNSYEAQPFRQFHEEVSRAFDGAAPPDVDQMLDHHGLVARSSPQQGDTGRTSTWRHTFAKGRNGPSPIEGRRLLIGL